MRSRFDRDWTKGSITGNLVSLGWPMMVSGSLNMLGPTIDMIWVGKLGAASIAGVGVSGMIVMLVNSAMMGLYQGLRAIIARAIGAGNPEEANHVAQQALIISLVYSAVMAAIGIFFARPILLLMGVGPDVVDEGVPYLRINFIGMISMSLRMVTEATMQASGDAQKPMWVAIFFRAFHVVLSPVLIFGLLVFPRLGVTGAAVTNVFSQGLGAAIGMWFLFSGRSRLRLTMKNFQLDGKMIWRIIKIGLPASIMGMERTFGNLILIRFMAPFGTLGVAGHTLNQRVEFLANVPAMGMGQAAGVLAGQNLGAGQPERAVKTGWQSAGLLSVLMTILAGAILLWAEYIIRIFSPDPKLIEMAAAFIRIAASGYLLMGLVSSFQQCISGAGDTLVPMAVTLVNMWVVQIPLAYFLPQVGGLGVYGVRWAMVAGSVSAAIAYTIYFAAGRWKRIKV
ncbi:MAG: MATE family efflux transporter [Chloroflexi bacterium]|nr:MATE family efflux transporter [Chloroflexota bacterium]